MPGHTLNDGAGDVTGLDADSDARSRAGGTRRTFLATAAATAAALPVGGTALAGQQDASATVTFDDQRTDGTSVTVASATLSEGGFVTIHDGVLLDSKGDVVRERRRFLESVVGVSASLDPGDHQNVEVELFSGVPGRDNGRRVTVASVSLPAHGFIAIHDSSLSDGSVLDSVIGVSRETAGDHENVPVDLFTGLPGREFERQALQGDETLVAMPHEDSNGNFTYDFVCTGGEQDGPFTTDGEAVVDDARVTLAGR